LALLDLAGPSKPPHYHSPLALFDMGEADFSDIFVSYDLRKRMFGTFGDLPNCLLELWPILLARDIFLEA
jgi:hypothetical protein